MKLELENRNMRDREVPHIAIVDEDGKVIADTLNGDLASVLEECDESGVRYYDVGSRPIMEEIVRIVNCHDELLAALKDLVAVNERWNEAVSALIGRPQGWNAGYLDKAKAAIRKAEERS